MKDDIDIERTFLQLDVIANLLIGVFFNTSLILITPHRSEAQVHIYHFEKHLWKH